MPVPPAQGVTRPIGLAMVAFALLMLFAAEPALANKFETIGGGLSGSSGIKREWLQGFFMVVAGLCLFGAILTVVVPHKNALYLNSTSWKASFGVLMTFSAIFGSAAFLI